MGVMGLKLAPVFVRCLFGLPGMSGPMADASWTHSYSKQTYNIRYNLPPAAHPLAALISPHPLPHTHPPSIRATCDITVAVKKVVQNPTVLASLQK